MSPRYRRSFDPSTGKGRHSWPSFHRSPPMEFVQGPETTTHPSAHKAWWPENGNTQKMQCKGILGYLPKIKKTWQSPGWKREWQYLLWELPFKEMLNRCWICVEKSIWVDGQLFTRSHICCIFLYDRVQMTPKPVQVIQNQGWTELVQKLPCLELFYSRCYLTSGPPQEWVLPSQLGCPFWLKWPADQISKVSLAALPCRGDLLLAKPLKLELTNADIRKPGLPWDRP